MEKITGYIRKSHSFTKEALDHLGVLNKYMGDIGESAVLRYLIINEIRKVPSPHKYGQVHVKALDDAAISRVLGEDEG
jgi:hypothetical protein